MKTRTREIAKVGIFGSIDNPTIVTEKDLKEVAETFPDIVKAPIQFGHWGDAANPRLGNVIAVSYDPVAKSLSGSIEEDDTLSKAVDDGYYPDVSLGAKQRASDGKMYIHHLAYLGQESPAIKDLISSIKEPLGIAASDVQDVRQFPNPAERTLVLSEPFDMQHTNGNEGTSPAENPGRASQSPAGGKTSLPATQIEEEKEVTETEAAALKAENDKLKADAAAKEIQLSDVTKKQKESEKAKLKTAMEGRVPKALQDRVLALADTFVEGKSIELSDGDAKRQASPLEVLSEVFSAMQTLVEPGALNLGDTANPEAPAKIGAARSMMGHV